ncbi:hypothetical protein QTA58_17970 [Neorhizobium sp. CSC1952]|uniref:hypothetical protein n=1 Tax=Neorhizobium sp. CSC1952 TaxID=2978974 RepID=UPI0025A5E9B5|nr:hypothetical protein [Rhizobium sp. CSC1952]WJR69651.1 hypothetical protein QTA58_17970 [Rhizobium sp. CSC1952]
MQQPPTDPVPNPQPPVPPPATPIPPIEEPEPDRLPDEEPNPNPDETDEPAKYTRHELATTYGISEQEAARLIDRFGASSAELDLILAAKGRTKNHRRQDIAQTAEEIAFG